MSLLALAGLGLALGIRHATDSDHVVAVTAIAARYKRVGPAARVGVLWGLGHTLTICVVGALIIWLNLTLPPRVGLALEFVVGIALVVVGALNLTGRGGFISAATHTHEQGVRAFVVGLVHGLAGSAAVALLVLATVHDPRAAVAYLLVFGLGTIVGMVLITLAFTSPVAYMARRYAWSGTGLRLLTGALSVCFGLYVMYDVAFVSGLFLANPHWSPH